MGKYSSPEEVRIAIVSAVSVCSFSFTYVVSLFQFVTSPHVGRMVLLKLRSDSEWVGEETFSARYNFLRNCFKTSTDDPVLLIRDNRARHVLPNLHVFCRNNGITVISSSCYTSRRSKSRDLAFYGHLKATFKKKLKRCKYEKY